MKPLLLLITLILGSALPFAQAENDRYKNVPPGGVLDSGPLPDLKACTADGTPIKLRDLCKGQYTVLAAGCLTCPVFHQNYPGIEAVHADYKDKGVQFFYFYKSLRHPELGGYVEAQNISERLLQLAEAKKKLGTQIPWIADTLDDSMRIGLRSGSYSVYLISPEGEIIHADDRINPASLRAALVKEIGPVKNPTDVSDLDLPMLEKQPKLINEDTALTVARPAGLAILKITPKTPEDTYYVKLRAEADDALLNTGTGELYLGFYPDPIHDVHWNNLSPPMKYTLSLPDGATATPAQATANKGPGDSDTLPRQFRVAVKGAKPDDEFQLRLDYFGCTSDLCLALTHEYTIKLEFENRGASTYGLNRGPGGGKRKTSTMDTKEKRGRK